MPMFPPSIEATATIPGLRNRASCVNPCPPSADTGQGAGLARRLLIVERARRILPTILVVLATLLLFVGLVTAYASGELFDAEGFSNRAVSALDDDQVRGLIAAGVADGVVKRDPDLIGARPLLEGAAGGIAGSAPFQQLFRDAVEDLHRTVFSSDKDTVALKLADVAVLLIEGLRQVAP